MPRKGKRNFGGSIPQIFSKPCNSHITTWVEFKKQRGITGPLTSVVLRQFAACLLGRFRFSSTNGYLSSVVSYEGHAVQEALFERNYACLRAAVSRIIKREGLGGKSARLIGRSSIDKITSVRKRMILRVACSLGIRSKTLVGIRASDVEVRLKRKKVVGLNLSVKRDDKVSAYRKLDCTLARPLGSDEEREIRKLFPIKETELKAALGLAGGSLHSPRRVAAVRARFLYESIAEENPREARTFHLMVNARQGWMESSEEFFSYSRDFTLHALESLPEELFREDL